MSDKLQKGYQDFTAHFHNIVLTKAHNKKQHAFTTILIRFNSFLLKF